MILVPHSMVIGHRSSEPSISQSRFAYFSTLDDRSATAPSIRRTASLSEPPWLCRTSSRTSSTDSSRDATRSINPGRPSGWPGRGGSPMRSSRRCPARRRRRATFRAPTPITVTPVTSAANPPIHRPGEASQVGNSDSKRRSVQSQPRGVVVGPQDELASTVPAHGLDFQAARRPAGSGGGTSSAGAGDGHRLEFAGPCLGRQPRHILLVGDRVAVRPADPAPQTDYVRGVPPPGWGLAVVGLGVPRPQEQRLPSGRVAGLGDGDPPPRTTARSGRCRSRG